MLDVSTKQARARFYGSSEWKQLREDILDRDNRECQFCKAEELVVIEGGFDRHGNPVVLEVDHIEELKDRPDLALEPSNLRTLCKDCHNKRHERFNYRPSEKKRKWDDEWW
ncbi:MAG: HNH endonuclease [Vagococcus sp.]|jgi:5-methylcytosine-specific restriction endonuclease McrA|nr:HNH endonuclease [Vagococcus sp.]